MKTKILILVIAAMAMLTAGYAQTFDKVKMDQYFDRLAEHNKAMGTLVISKDGKVLYTKSIGYGQIGEAGKKPLNIESRYRIASITKMYTAVMILQLAEEGKLELTDKLSKFFAQIPNAEKITIADILAHRSGIHDALLDPALRPHSKSTAVTKEEIVAMIAKGKPDFEPGTKHSYSNSGYALLGMIVEKVSGKPYDEALRERIISKIGLRDTYVATGAINASKNESLTYRYTGGWKPEPETHPSILFGGGSIISTPVEMTKFIHALFEMKLISKINLDLMRTIRDGEGSGMEAFQWAGKTFYGHTGGGDNNGAWLAYMPGEKLAVAYATNAKVHPVADIMKSIMDIYYNKPFDIPSFESFAVSVEVLEKYTGIYSTTEAPVKFTVTRNGNTLFIQPPGQSAVPLEALAPDKFKIEGTNGVSFEFDPVKKQMTVKRPQGERIFIKEN